EVEARDFAVGIFGPKCFAEPPTVARNDGGCKAEDGAGGPVVLLELDCVSTGKFFGKGQDVFDLRAAESVDRLVVVPDNADVGRGASHCSQPFISRKVGTIRMNHDMRSDTVTQ